MKHLLTTLIFPALLFSATTTLGQEATPTDTAPGERVVALYPEKAMRKKFKMQKHRESVLPYGIIATDKAAMVLSALVDTRIGIYQDILLSASKDGTEWSKIALVLPKVNLNNVEQSNMGAVYDSVRKQIVLFFWEQPTFIMPDKKGEPLDNSQGQNRVWVSVGKGGKFAKPKDITKQFEGKNGGSHFSIEGHGLHFQGICLTRGEHRGRLLFIACIKDKTICSLYSDDHGRSWKTGSATTVRRASPYSLGDGLTLFEAEDGSVLSFLSTDGQKSQWLCSEDGGTSWVEKTSQPGQVATQPGWWPNAYLILKSKDGDGADSRLLAISTIDTKAERQTHIALSYDWGLTWPHRKTINAAVLITRNNLPIQLIAPGTIGMVTNSSAEIAPRSALQEAGFTTFTLSWLTDGKDDGIDEEESPEAKE